MKLSTLKPEIHKSPIEILRVSENGQHLFSGDSHGVIGHWHIPTNKLVTDYGSLNSCRVTGMVCGHGDPEFLFTVDTDKNLNQLSVREQILVKGFPNILQGTVDQMVVTLDNQYLFIGDRLGNMKQFTIQKDFQIKMNLLLNTCQKYFCISIWTLHQFQ